MRPLFSAMLLTCAAPGKVRVESVGSRKRTSPRIAFQSHVPIVQEKGLAITIRCSPPWGREDGAVSRAEISWKEDHAATKRW